MDVCGFFTVFNAFELNHIQKLGLMPRSLPFYGLIVEPSWMKNAFLPWIPWILGTSLSNNHVCHGQKSRFFGDGRPPTFNRNPYFMGI